MAFDPAAADRLRRILSRRRDVVERKMMGILGFVVGGAMCCGVRGDALMARVDAEGR